jgi:hypothetical protein
MNIIKDLEGSVSGLTEVLSRGLPLEKGIEEHHKSSSDWLVGALDVIQTENLPDKLNV